VNNKVSQFLETCRLTCIGWEEPRVYPLLDGGHIIYFPDRDGKLMTVTVQGRHNLYLNCLVQELDTTKPSSPPSRRFVSEDHALLIVKQFLQPPVKSNTRSYLFVGAVSIVVALAYSLGYLLQGG
jgi:hypothetical protein